MPGHPSTNDSCTEAPTEQSPPRPTGREEVRAAVLTAAAQRFADEGPHASLRDIAADAGVNLGLIHRHFGNKDDLLRAVLNDIVRSGTEELSRAPDTATAVRQIFEGSRHDGRYVRIIAWLLLERGSEVREQDDYPGMAALRALAARDAAATPGPTDGSDDRDDPDAPTGDDRLMAAMATIYGWAVFGPQVLASFGRAPPERDAVERRIARLVEELATPPATG